jgi:hypothetical protein
VALAGHGGASRALVTTLAIRPGTMTSRATTVSWVHRVRGHYHGDLVPLLSGRPGWGAERSVRLPAVLAARFDLARHARAIAERWRLIARGPHLS